MITFAAPPIPSPPKKDTCGPPQLDGVPHSGFVYGEVPVDIPESAFDTLAFSRMLFIILFTFAFSLGPYPIVHSFTPLHFSFPD